QDASPDQPKVAVVDGALVVPGETGGPRRWLYYHSHLFRLLKTSVLEGRVRSLLGMKEPWAVRELRSEFSLYEPSLPAELRGGAEATERGVAKLASLARSRSTRVLAVLIPSLPQGDPAKWEAVLAQLGLDPARHDRRRPNRLFREIFERHKVPVLDLTDAFEREGRSIYYAMDQHLNPEGYALMARLVGEALTPPTPLSRSPEHARPGRGGRNP
ncbi:MAG TPA: hypothetical protein VE078_08255, partial [Thermoanaerobaculia bacterium]|nr:hypothetical protein [Thermoanaerobaculia bacterium]